MNIQFVGPAGSGKSTYIKLLAEALGASGVVVSHQSAIKSRYISYWRGALRINRIFRYVVCFRFKPKKGWADIPRLFWKFGSTVTDVKRNYPDKVALMDESGGIGSLGALASKSSLKDIPDNFLIWLIATLGAPNIIVVLSIKEAERYSRRLARKRLSDENYIHKFKMSDDFIVKSRKLRAKRLMFIRHYAKENHVPILLIRGEGDLNKNIQKLMTFIYQYKKNNLQ